MILGESNYTRGFLHVLTVPFAPMKLLRHIGHGKICWFCPHCWQDFPNLDEVLVETTPKSIDSERPH